MKCTACMALNAPDDDFCVSCGQYLDRPGRIARAEKAEQVRNTPAWAYFFAALCGVIPVFTLGGIVPIAVGVGGVTGCLAVGRASSVPTAFRVLTCLFIVGGCWGGTLLFLMMLFKSLKHR